LVPVKRVELPTFALRMRKKQRLATFAPVDTIPSITLVNMRVSG